MSTYLTFYLQPRSKKKEDGTTDVENPKPMPIFAYSGGNEIFSVFREEIPNIAYENEEGTNYTELSADDAANVLNKVEESIAKTQNQIRTIRENLKCIKNKEVIEDKLSLIEGLREYEADQECVAQEIRHILYLVREIDFEKDWAAFEKVLINIG